jgi:hypothetical protein
MKPVADLRLGQDMASLPTSAKRLGIRESGFGALLVIFVAAGHSFGF